MIIDSAIYSRTFALCIFRKVILIDIFRQKPPESFQKVYVFSFILRNVPNIWATFKEFSYKTKIFQNISGIRKKNLKYFPKNPRIWKKPSEL